MYEVILNELPTEHSMRNTPLIAIGAYYQWVGGGPWNEVKPAFGIANKTFNQLGETWTKYDTWKATISKEGKENVRINSNQAQ